MRICHVAHGVMPIPPRGWGAVESLIWDYKYHIERLGHSCYVINDPHPERVTSKARALAPDVLHVHCERFFGLAGRLDVPVTVLCSHWPLLFQPSLAGRAMQFTSGDAYIACLSDRSQRHLEELGVNRNRLFLAKNGADSDRYRFSTSPRLHDRSVCLGAICKRKRQYLIQHIDSVDFVGPQRDLSFDCFSPNYLGEWSKPAVEARLTDYGNLVLLSSDEVAPLVTVEALMGGLGLVVSKAAAANLDTSKPFISVVEESELTHKEHLRRVIDRNREVSLGMRSEIRQYALAEFDWRVLVQQYLDTLKKLLVC